MNFDHFVITRFYYPEISDSLFKKRLNLFHRFTVPSIIGQTNQNFKWLICSNFSSKQLGVEHLPNVFIIKNLTDFLKITDNPYVVTSRLDNDDGVSLDWIQLIQDKTKQANQFPYFIDFNGVVLCDKTGSVWEKKRKLPSPFLSCIEETKNALGVYQDNHCRIKNVKKESEVVSFQVVHENNLANSIKNIGKLLKGGEIRKRWNHLGLFKLYSLWCNYWASLSEKENSWVSLVRDKKQGKKFALQEGIKVARFIIPPDNNFIIKPVRSHSRKGFVQFAGSEYLIEEYLEDAETEQLRDFRFLCFGNRVKLIQVSDGFESRRHNWFNPENWNELTIDKVSPKIDCEERPPCIDEMICIAERVSKAFPIPIRVDLYWTKKGIYFGELCFTPGVAMTKRIDQKANQWLGKLTLQHLGFKYD